MKLNPIPLLTLLFAFTQSSAHADVHSDVRRLQDRWAEVNYRLQDKAQLTAYEQLVTDAEQVTVSYPQAAEGWIWRGIIQSSYAGAKGGLGALGQAKAARESLEKALALDASALNGSAYTSLGTLYFKVPGWPVGFGDDDKAAELLQKALAINPNGIDSNYFYAEYLRDQGNDQDAERYLLKAQQAAPRPGRELADQGRQAQIRAALAALHEKLARH
jgi:tetratricopeptide (TPR) repeat protein